MMINNRERRQLYLHDYGDLIVQQQLLMVHWILQEATRKDLQKETMFLSANLFDRFLSEECCFKTERYIQIAATVCLTLAARTKENQPFNSIWRRTFIVAGTAYSYSEVVAMESLLQQVLNFQCYLPTVYNLWFYLKAARATEHLVRTGKQQALQALLGSEHLRYRPSTVVSAMAQRFPEAISAPGLVPEAISAPELARVPNLDDRTNMLLIRIYNDKDLEKIDVPATYPPDTIFLKPDRGMSREQFQRVKAFALNFPHLVLLPLEGGGSRNKSMMKDYGVPLAIIGILFFVGYKVVTTLQVITKNVGEVSTNISKTTGTIDLWIKQGCPLNLKLHWLLKTKHTGDSGVEKKLRVQALRGYNIFP